jgi:adenine-specific DNA-methyltransferase
MLGKLWVLPSKPSQLNALEKNLDQPHTLDTLGLTVNTGAIEVHRPECKVSKPCTVLYSRDFDSSANVTWNEKTKPRFYASARGVMPLPDNKSGYVVLKRITANDGNKNRLMPAWISKESTGLSEIGFDNHVQVISSNGKPLSKTKGLALVLFLSSIEANECMSAISGTTQINIDDLKALRYPNIDKVTHK